MSPPRTAISAALLAAILIPSALAQEYGSPYYGKNKVVYEKFAWKSYATEHFRIFFYADDMALLKNAADTAESAYRKVSSALKHELADPVPLIYYTTHTDFEQTHLFEISEGVLGVAEPIHHRIGIHGDMGLDELQRLITHELTHIFEFEILWSTPGALLTAISPPPLWTFEGLSEYLTGEWSFWSALILRDAVMNDRIPDFSKSGELVSRHPMPREPACDFGHAVFEFMETRFGRNSAREFFKSLKDGSRLLGRRNPLKKAFKMEPREFAREFKKYLRTRFKDYFGRENPEDYSVPLGPEFPMNPDHFAFSHAVSPSGDLVATITFNSRDGDIDIVLLSARDGKVVRNLTKGFTARYESIKYEIDPSLGKSLAWSRDGDRLAFFARAGRKHALFILDALAGAALRKIPVAFDQPVGPVFHPDGKTVLFSAFEKGVRDIFSLDLETGQASNLTRDDLYEKAPALSPDGRSVAYSIRVDAYDKLFLSPAGDFRKKTQLTFGRGNTVNPEFSADGRTLFFSGDARDAHNIYSLSLDSGELRRYTDVRTGNFFPAPLPNVPGTVVFSAFNKGAFQLFKSTAQGTVEQTLTFADAGAGETFKKFEPPLTFEIDKGRIQAHAGLDKLYIAPRMPVGVGVSTDGSIFGKAGLVFQDILGDHSFSIAASQVRDFRSVFLGYLNRKNRVQWAINAFRTTVYYYPDLYHRDPVLWSTIDYQDVLTTQKITGASASVSYPFNKHIRAEGSLGFFRYEGDFYDPYSLGGPASSASGYFLDGDILSAAASLTGETTRFKRYGPAAGSTFRLAFDWALPAAETFLHSLTLTADLRHYLYLGSDCLAAFRFRGFASFGRDPALGYYGGDNEIRSAHYRGILGTKYWYANAELRLPLISTASTVVGPVGPVRAVIFFDVTQSRFRDGPAKFARLASATSSSGSSSTLEFGAIGSYGYGIELFIFGLPVHIEFAKRLEWPSFSRPFKFSPSGDFITNFWVGFDF